ncbi:TraX family protein [Pannus brasiliensis]|uniref:TraX family protein n=1 Tax=Pannus brasiliensis TaxID=1579216 RepID=UPI003BEF4401
MVIDHLGFPNDLPLRVVGRLSFPIFLYFLIQGNRFTKNFTAYFWRLLFFAVFSQIPYSLFFNKVAPNIFFTLALCLFCLRGRRSIYWVGAAIVAWFFRFDFGYYGVLLCWFMSVPGEVGAWAIWGLHLVYCFVWPSWLVQFFAVFAIYPLRWWGARLSHYRRSARWFYWVYPVHLFFLLGFRYLRVL